MTKKFNKINMSINYKKIKLFILQVLLTVTNFKKKKLYIKNKDT